MTETVRNHHAMAFFSSKDWDQHGILWAYRFYGDGLVLFAYSGPLTRLFLNHTSTTATIDAAEVLGSRIRLNEFLFGFTRENHQFLTFRSGLPGVTLSEWHSEEGQILFTHDYFGIEQLSLRGAWCDERLVLSMEVRKTLPGGKDSVKQIPGSEFLRLDSGTK